MQRHVKNFDAAIEHIFEVEGDEFVNHPDDKGGPTKFGITLRTLGGYYDILNLNESKIRDLGADEAVLIYQDLYWDRLGLDRVYALEKCLAIFDVSVHSGTNAAAEMTQVAINKSGTSKLLRVDGIFGPLTIAAINAVDNKTFGLNFFKEIQRHYVSICRRDKTQLIFLQGWINRSYLVLGFFLESNRQ